MHLSSSYTITFETIKLLLRIESAKERTLLIFSPESLSSLREAERLFTTKSPGIQNSTSNLCAHFSWEIDISSPPSIIKLASYLPSIKNFALLPYPSLIKNKKTKKISPSTRFSFKEKKYNKKNSSELSEGSAIHYIKTSFFERVALLFYQKYN